MNKNILLIALCVPVSFFANAQYAAKTYAITGNAGGDFSWKNIRQVDLVSGKVIRDIYVSGSTTKFTDAVSNKELSADDIAKISVNDFVAASAYDVRTNKLFYSTMNSGQLRWINLDDRTALNIHTKQQQFISPNIITDESVNITRMCIAADGNGYALSNDGNHLYRFTTDAVPVVTDLGNLVDAAENTGMSVHNKCSSWGGDLVADAFGKLYIISATHNVFTIDIDSRIATFSGTITGLPGTYTTNGAAVDDDGNIVVNSSSSKDGYYKVKFPELTSTKIEGSDASYSVSDLANANLLLQKEADAARNIGAPLPAAIVKASGHVYPNPTSNSTFNVSFDGMKTGKYNIEVTDLSGKSILTRPVTVSTSGQIEKVNVSPKLSVGMYMIKVASEDKQNSFTERIVIN